jgi:hypothetical protein
MPYKEEFASKLEHDVYKLLLDKGFPAESILYEPAILPIGSNIKYRPDFLILDPATGEHLALIEVKSPHLAGLYNAKNQLEAYKKALGNPRIASYVITSPDDLPEDLRVLSSDEVEERTVDSEVFPKYETLKASSLAGKKAELKTKREEVTTSLEKVGFTVAILLVFVVVTDFVLSFWKITLLTPERLGLLGAAVALVVIPFLQKFKGLGIEWEKSQK